LRFFDPELKPVLESGYLAGTTWRSQKALEPGKQYLWQVTASVRDRKILAPQPPDPEAPFLGAA
jgi:hypothetical protein